MIVFVALCLALIVPLNFTLPSATAAPPIQDSPREPITAAKVVQLAEIADLYQTGGNVWMLDFSPSGLLLAHDSDVNRVLFSPDGSLLATAGEDGSVRLWAGER